MPPQVVMTNLSGSWTKFKDKVRPDIRSHLDEQKVEELEKAAVMADDYALTHKMSSKSGNPQQKRYHGSGNSEYISRNTDNRKRQGMSEMCRFVQ